MGLNRELREINRQLLTDKQEKQLERLQHKQEKQLINDITNFVDYYIINYLNKSFLIYSKKLYQFELINEIKQACISESFTYSNKEFISLNFDNIYYKELNKIIKRYKLNQKAQPQQQEKVYNVPSAGRILFWLIFHFINILHLCLAGFNTGKRRL